MGMTNISQLLTIKQTKIANQHVYGTLCVLAKPGDLLASRNVCISSCGRSIFDCYRNTPEEI